MHPAPLKRNMAQLTPGIQASLLHNQRFSKREPRARLEA
jgi:hypothetical protein